MFYAMPTYPLPKPRELCESDDEYYEGLKEFLAAEERRIHVNNIVSYVMAVMFVTTFVGVLALAILFMRL